MSRNDLYALFLESLKFRKAVERCDKSRLPENLSKFPEGVCREIVLLFSEHLNEKGFGEFEYVEGTRRGRQHAWLKRGTTIVDITADQFEDQDEKVIVSSRSCWHDEFCGNICEPKDGNTADIDIVRKNIRDIIFSSA
jgi:hypothetical protein